MGLKPTEIQWIEDVAKIVPQMDAAVDLEDKKQKLLTAARQEIDKHVGEIQMGNDFKIEMLSDFFKFKYEMATVTGDPNTEFDIGHDMSNVSRVDPQQIKKLTDAQTIVFSETEKLRKARNDATKKPLFTDKEISDAIWEPLKRRKLVPEAAIPDRYSEVSRGFAGASEGYGDRLDAYNESLGDENKVLEGLGIAKDVLGAAGSIAGGVISSLKAMGLDKLGTMSPDAVSDILKGVNVGISSGIDIATTLVKSDGKLDGDVIAQVCKSVVTIAQAEITAGLTTQSDTTKALGDAISSGIGVVMNGGTIARILAKGDANIVEVASELGDMVEGCFTIYAKQLEFREGKENESNGTEPKKDDKSVSMPDKIEMIGKAAKGAIKGFGGWAAFVEKPSKETLAESLLGMIQAGVETTGDEMSKLKQVNKGKDISWDKFEKSVTAITDSLNALRAADDKQRAKMVEEDPSLKALADLVKKEEAAALEGQQPEKFGEEVEEDTRNFRDMLNRSETGESEEDIQKVEQLMAQMKKDQMIVNLAFQLVSMPAKAVAAFLPAAGMAVSAISLVQNMTKAREHFIAYQEWKENASDSRSAMSFQMEAMLNRQNNSRNQTADATVKALTDAAQIVCQAVSCAGPFAPAGKVAGAAVSGVAAIKDLILKYVAKSDLEKAYQAYKKARENPDDRKQMREAVRKNATLAKYLIAWGALVDNNIMARRAMEKCGITQEMLSNKNTNAQNAVSYLEAMYPEDPVVLAREENPKPWYPGPVLFTSISFAAFVHAAENRTDPKLKSGSCDKLLELFSRWEQLDADQKKARETWNTAVRNTEAQNAGEGERQAEQKAMLALQLKLDKAEAAAQELVRRLPVDPMVTDAQRPAEHTEMKTYLRMLVPMGLAYTKAYRRAAEALERQDGALQRDPNSSRIVIPDA
jgi:hypothetical protein